MLKAELEKLREENKTMRESFSKANSSSCPNCGGGGGGSPDDLHLENTKLKAELDKLRAALGRTPYPLQASCSDDQHRRVGSLELYTGVFALEKSRIVEIANRATLEVLKMATSGEPLWLRSLETGREILNYDEYLKEFPQAQASSFHGRKTIEASRDVGIVFMDAHKLAQSFMDVVLFFFLFHLEYILILYTHHYVETKNIDVCICAGAMERDVCMFDLKGGDG